MNRDADCLPDWWDDALGALEDRPDPDADPDGDGLTNIQEYLAGALPQNSDSNLMLSIPTGAALLALARHRRSRFQFAKRTDRYPQLYQPLLSRRHAPGATDGAKHTARIWGFLLQSMFQDRGDFLRGQRHRVGLHAAGHRGFGHDFREM